MFHTALLKTTYYQRHDTDCIKTESQYVNSYLTNKLKYFNFKKFNYNNLIFKRYFLDKLKNYFSERRNLWIKNVYWMYMKYNGTYLQLSWNSKNIIIHTNESLLNWSN